MQLGDALFVIVPGIGGSLLERSASSGPQIVWGGVGQLAARLVSPGTLVLADDDGIEAVGLLESWRLLPGLALVHGYEGLIQLVANLSGGRIDYGRPEKRDDGARVVAFPYDFRRSIVEAAVRLRDDVGTRLDALGSSEDARTNRVVVVAHSMGGLVARYWAACLGGAPYCKAIITLGTPHRGAPKALDVVVNGLRVGSVRVPGGLSEVVRSWDGTYDLLPRYQAVESASGRHYPDEVDVEHLDRTRAATSGAIHRDIEASWQDLTDAERPAVTPVIGLARKTVEGFTWADSSLWAHPTPPRWILDQYPGTGGTKGDGTVPRVSAVPIELDTAAARPTHRPWVGAKHTKMMGWSGLRAEIINAVTGMSAGGIRGAGNATLVVDVPDAWPAHTEQAGTIRVVRPMSDDAVPRPADNIVRVQIDHGDGWEDADESGRGEWEFELPPKPEGETVVLARAVAADGDDPAPGREPIRIVDLEREDGW